MATKSDKTTDFAERQRIDEMSSADRQREEWKERASRETKFEGEVDPASMIISPHTKPKIESETKVIGAYQGDPRVISALAVDTPTEGTETPWRDTPPTNVTSVFETANDHSPPHEADVDPDDLNAQPEDGVPEPTVETRSAVEVFPPERDADMEPPRPRKSDKFPEAVELEKA